jgi:hypothetical protein
VGVLAHRANLAPLAIMPITNSPPRSTGLAATSGKPTGHLPGASGITEGAAFRAVDRHGRLGVTRVNHLVQPLTVALYLATLSGVRKPAIPTYR